MKKPIIGYILLFLMFAAFVYFTAIQKDMLTTAEALPIITGIASAEVLWIWMAINLILNRKNIRHPYLWGFLFFVANWITAIIYFLFKYVSGEKTNSIYKIIAWINKGNSKISYYLKLSIICFITTIVHHSVMMEIYTSIGLQNNKIYYLIFVESFYLPLTLLLKVIYNMLLIDIEHPSNDLIMMGRVLSFIYRYIILLIFALVIMRYVNCNEMKEHK